METKELKTMSCKNCKCTCDKKKDKLVHTSDIDEIAENIQEMFLNAKPERYSYIKCSTCNGTGKEFVFGGPDRDCPECGPRY